MSSLDELWERGAGVTLLASPAYAERAQQLGRRVAAARGFFARLFGVNVDVTAFVLDEADWRAHCPFPSYGMPFSAPPEALYAAATDNDLWRSALPDMALLPPPVVARLQDVYAEGEGLSARRFFDLLVVHELAHLFEHAGGLRFPRRWLRELFCNLALHAYVESDEPGELPALETLPEVVASLPAGLLPHHTLRDWEELFENVGPLAFAWYQCRLHRAAAGIHRTDGPGAAATMWAYFAGGPGAAVPPTVTDHELAALLSGHSPEVAAVLTAWPSA